MVNQSFKKATSCLIVGVVSAALIGQNTSFAVEDATDSQGVASSGTSTTDSIDASSNNIVQNTTPAQVEAKERASVHDPSIVKDENTGEYYVFGSHIEAAKSSDLQNWDKFTNSYTTPGNKIFGDLSSNLAGSFAWAGENDSDSKGGYAVWAPNVIWNKDYVNTDGSKGAYMMYYCTSSTYKRSDIGYAVSQNIEGPYTYVDTIVYSGFTKSHVTDSNSTKDTIYTNTHIDELISAGKLTGVNSKWFNSDGSYNTDYAPNAIDPELFWDKDGTLWMNYGSWSGGIFMLQIDPATGKPIYPGSDVNTSSANNTDRYFGKRVAGGHTDSGEGSEIVYDKATGYYYLYMSYAGLAAQGGYNIRMFRSTSPTGPFVDEKGQNAALSGNVDNTAYGIKLIGNYKFNCLDVGYRSAGHNSSFIDDDGQMYLVYHTRFDDGTENHQVRVHQMFINEDGWPVVAPYENSGDSISSTGYSVDDIVGNYQFINHGTSSSASMLDTQNVRLNSDGSITGDITGTWSKTDGTYYMNAVIDGVTYKGVFFKQQDESSYENKVMTFSAVGTNNEVIWGSKLELSDSEALSYVDNVITNSIPSNTKTDLTLPTSGAYDTTITWSSSDKDIISTDGKVNRPTGADKTVKLTATISTKSGQSTTKEFSVLVKGILNFTEAPIYQYDFNSVDGTSIVNTGSVGTTTSASATLIGNSSIVDDDTMGKVLQVKSKTGAIDANYLALPSNSFSTITEKGFTVGMWLNIDTTDSNYWQHSAIFEGDSSKTYPMTRIGANLIARINAGGSYSDTDIASLKSNTWQYLTYTVGTTGIVVYVNGVEVGRQNKDITASLANNIISKINNIRVGSGSIWNDKDLASAKFDNIAIYDSALTDQEVEGLYTRELSSLPETPAINSVTTTPASVTLTPGDTKKLTATVDAAGGADETVTWSSNDTNGKVTVDQDGLVSVAKDAALGDYEIKAASTLDSSKFGTTTVKVVSKSDNTGTNTDTLEITKQPDAQTVTLGNTAKFSVEVQGTAPFTYQWQKDKKNLENGDNISGANKATVEIDNVTANDAGDYRCIISDEIGNTTTSSAVKLTLTSSSTDSNNSSTSSSSSSSKKHHSTTLISTSTSNTNSTVTVAADETAILNAIKTSTEKTIIINVPDTAQSNPANNTPILNPDIILGLKNNSDKTLVLKIKDSDIEIKGKDGQIQFIQNNIPLTGFKTIGQTKYYLDSNGIMRTGWIQDSGSNWYYLDKATGAMKSSWLKETNGSWYYLDKTSGVMKTGWVQETNGTWYYLDRTSGTMKTGWIQDNGQWYYLYSDGSLATSTTINGYLIDENGKWIG